jgi:tetratricopeptide (TPR) repeat protein
VLARDERDQQARRVSIHACIARGRLDEAERILRRAVELEPGVLANRIALARILARRLVDEALERRPDALRAQALIEEIAAWSREDGAPPGVGELAHAVALELGVERRETLAARVAGPDAPARTREEAELRAGLLDAVGRRGDADRLLAQLREGLSPDDPTRREIARIEFRRAVFGGDTQAARHLLASELRRDGAGDATGVDVALDAVICLVDGREADARALIETRGQVSREVAAWFDALRDALDGGRRTDRGRSRDVDVAAEAALRLVEARRALRSGVPQEALRRADDAVLLARGRFDDAEAVAIESLVRLGRHDEALGRADRLVDATGARPAALAWRLFCESHLRGRRSREAVVADARAVFAADDADIRSYACAAAALGAAGEPGEASVAFARAVEGAEIADSECIALAECAVVLARAFDDMSLVRAVHARIDRGGDAPSDERRWALAWMDALEAEHRGDAARAFDVLRAAAGESRQRLAIAGQFGDARGIDSAAALLRASLPEGASIVAGTQAALVDPTLAVAAAEALEPEGELRGTAVARLRLATAHPGSFDVDDVLATAAEARRRFPLDVDLLAGIARFLLAISPPDPAQALAVLGDAIRLAPRDARLREHAVEAALLAGETTLAREHAEALPASPGASGATSSTPRAPLLAAISIAEGDGRGALRALAGFGRAAQGGEESAGARALDRAIAAMRAMALVLEGDVDDVAIGDLDAGIVRVSRMTPREVHRALVVRCAASGADPVLLAHLAAEYLHRVDDPEVAEIARRSALQALERTDGEGVATVVAAVDAAVDASGAIAAFRAAVACGDDALAERARQAMQVDREALGAHALRREEALALLVRDPTRARRIALEILAADPDDHEAALVAAMAALRLGETTPADADRVARAPRSPEVHLVTARTAHRAGRDAEARRAARDGIELAARRAYVAFETCEALQAIARDGSTESRGDSSERGVDSSEPRMAGAPE